MNTRNPATGPVDVYEALARGHAERGAFFASVFGGVSTLMKHLVAAVRPHRHGPPRKGAWA